MNHETSPPTYSPPTDPETPLTVRSLAVALALLTAFAAVAVVPL